MTSDMPIRAAFMPGVIERLPGGQQQSWDLPSRMLQERIVFLNGVIDDTVATAICMQLLYLEANRAGKEISLYINSPGGIVTAGLSIYDTMRFISSPITTVCFGQAASMGSLILAAGAPGQRFALPNARVMLHQPSGGFQGQATDILIHAEEIRGMKRRLNDIYAKHTGKDLKTIESALERDTFLSPDQAREFGIIDQVIEKLTDGVQEKHKP